jgi:hypothetical protein
MDNSELYNGFYAIQTATNETMIEESKETKPPLATHDAVGIIIKYSLH